MFIHVFNSLLKVRSKYETYRFNSNGALSHKRYNFLNLPSFYFTSAGHLSGAGESVCVVRFDCIRNF